MLKEAVEHLDDDVKQVEPGMVQAEGITQIQGKTIDVVLQFKEEFYKQEPETLRSILVVELIHQYYEKHT